MFYEPYKRKPKKRRKGCLGRVLKFAMLLGAAWLLIVVLTSGALDGFVDMVMGRSNALPGGWTHILLMGIDQSNEGVSRSDSLMVASVSSGGAVKLTSIMRDTLVDMNEHGKQKINAAYAYGGAKLAMDVVNRTFGLNISRYAEIDFVGFATIVDAVGGVELSITKEEMQAINKKKGHKLSGYGENTLLDGVQAVRYGRIRKIDSDYMRASRQRKILDAILDKARAIKNPIALFSMGQAVLGEVRTNMNVVDMGVLATKVLASGGALTQFRVPVEGTYDSGTQNGVWSIRADLEKNRQLLRDFIYG